MRTQSTIALISLLAIAAPVGALAQDRPDTNTPEARQAIEGYGQCVARLDPKEADRLLTMDFRTDRYRTGLRLLAGDAEKKCTQATFKRGVLRSAGLLFSGAMAEALLEAESKPLNARLASKAGVKAKSFSATDAVALCVARSVPDQVASLFATAPGTEAEAVAAAPLVQAVPVCANAAGVKAKLELSVPALRAMVATASYRLLADPGNANA